MFGERIMSTPLCDPEADEFFEGIYEYGDLLNRNMDATFISTLRYLLYHRIDDKTGIDLRLSLYERNDNSIINIINNAAITSNVASPKSYSQHLKNDIVICNFYHFSGNKNFLKCYKNDGLFKTLDQQGFRELHDLALFVNKNAHIESLFYINENRSTTIILTEGITLKAWHLMQSLIPRLVPWYFEETPLTEDEKNFLYTLSTNPDADAYKKCLYDFASRLNLRDSRIKRLLKDFESKRKEKEIGELELQIISFRNEIDRILERYKHLIHDIEDAATRKDGLKFQLENSKDMDSELINYLTCNKHVNLHRVTDNTFEIGVTTTLENYDPDLYDRMSKNRNSAIFKCYPVSEITFSKEEIRKRFLDAIFGDDPILKIKIKAGFELNFAFKSVNAIEQPVEYEDGYLYNPHLKIHHCIGNNRPEINQCLINSDYVGAIEQCIASAKNMNFAEGSITVSPFFRWLFDKNCEKVILMPDGTSKTPKEAYEWLLTEEVN